MHDDFILHCEPVARANSFVGTEEYLAPEVINASGHAAGESRITTTYCDLHHGCETASGWWLLFASALRKRCCQVARLTCIAWVFCCSGVDWWSLGILIYELVFGVTPFRGARRDETFENIIKAPLRFPQKPIISDECRDLIEKLLVKDVAKRLGSKSGAEEVKAHPFFKGINWALLRNDPPPYVPRRANKSPPASGTNFENY